MNKLSIVFAHYHCDNQLSKETKYYIEKLSQIDFLEQFILVSTSTFQKKDREYLQSLGINVFERENIGYDFYSYKVGIEHVKFSNCENLLICNDSVLGPLFDIESIVEEMIGKPSDMVGITQSFEYRYHLQSYFVLFKQNVLKSDAFKAFWDGVEVLKSKKEIIMNYEIGMSQYFLEQGFQLEAYANFVPNGMDLLFGSNKPRATIKQLIKVLLKLSPSSIKEINPTHYYWQTLIEKFHVPFIKKELVYKNPEKINVRDTEKYLIKMKND